jgi:epoxyqueuosine reductase
MGNRGEARYAPALTQALAHDAEPVVRGHAAWALGRVCTALAPAERGTARTALLDAARGDRDAWVREEAALAADGT